MVLYIVEECEMPCFFIGCYWRTDVYKNGRSPALLFFLFCFGRGTSVARRDQGAGLALPESCRGFCRSRYDAKKPEIGDEDSASLKTYLDASRMYDWNVKVKINFYLNPYYILKIQMLPTQSAGGVGYIDCISVEG